METIKVKVTSSKYDKGKSLNKIIPLPAFLVGDFLKYNYGVIIKESPEDYVT